MYMRFKKNILLSFVVGSSFLSFFLFFMGFHTYSNKYNKENCVSQWFKLEPYYFYTLLAPVYLGLMSVFALLIHQYTKISIRKSFLIISLLSPIIVSMAITKCKIYDFSKQRLMEQYLRLMVYHILLFNGIIANLYLAVTGK